jgi:transposase
MMGRMADEGQLFYDFRLEDYVPGNHLVRKLDTVLDLASLREKLAPFYSHTGRPSIDPELMIRMLIVGYCFGIRSERRLCEEMKVNLAYRWFCKLGLEGKVPDHSTFTHNRYGRFEQSDILRSVFEGIVDTCLSRQLVDGETFATDASIIKANASHESRIGLSKYTEISDGIAADGYISTLNDAAFGKATETPKKHISATDPAAQWTAAKGGAAFFAYSTNYLIDCKHGIIMDVEGSTAIRTGEVNATNRMIERTEERFGIKPQNLAADTAYGSGKNLQWLVEEKKIDPYIPVWDKSKRKDGTFSRSDFTWDAEKQIYLCPQGKKLKTTGTVHSGNTLYYFALKKECSACPLKELCCPNTPSRKIPRSIFEDSREKARDLRKTDGYKIAANHRKKVEMLFAHLKQNLNFRYLRTRGPTGVKQEFILAAIAQNLKRMTRLEMAA